MDKIKGFFKKLNESGLPVPIFRDGVTGKPSITFTLFYLNGIIAIGGLLGRFSKLVSNVDVDAAKELLLVTGGIYLGRQVSKMIDSSGKKETTMSSSSESK